MASVPAEPDLASWLDAAIEARIARWAFPARSSACRSPARSTTKGVRCRRHRNRRPDARRRPHAHRQRHQDVHRDGGAAARRPAADPAQPTRSRAMSTACRPVMSSRSTCWAGCAAGCTTSPRPTRSCPVYRESPSAPRRSPRRRESWSTPRSPQPLDFEPGRQVDIQQHQHRPARHGGREGHRHAARGLPAAEHLRAAGTDQTSYPANGCCPSRTRTATTGHPKARSSTPPCGIRPGRMPQARSCPISRHDGVGGGAGQGHPAAS